MVVAFLVMSSITVSAADTGTYQSKIKQNDYKLSGLEKEKNDVQQEKRIIDQDLENLIYTINQLQTDINTLSSNIFEKEKGISDKNLAIEEMTAQIEELKASIILQLEQIKIQEGELYEQEELLGLRVRAAYKFDTFGSALIILAESESLIDFTERLLFIERMAEKDREVMALIESIIMELDAKKVKLEASKAESEEIKQNLDLEKISLETEKQSLLEEQSVVLAKLEEQKTFEEAKRLLLDQMTETERELSLAIGDIMEENEVLEAEIQNLIKAEQEKARIEAQKKAEEEAEKNKVENVPQPEPDSGEENNSSQGYIRPVNGRVSSPYGNRIHPISGEVKMHTGIDYASPQGTGIKATRGGKVIVRQYNSSYGNYIIIDHGNGISSLYAHMSGFNVNYGDQVSQGEIIGFIGSTGSSTGPHLHFEIRVNGAHTNPNNYLN